MQTTATACPLIASDIDNVAFYALCCQASMDKVSVQLKLPVQVRNECRQHEPVASRQVTNVVT